MRRTFYPTWCSTKGITKTETNKANHGCRRVDDSEETATVWCDRNSINMTWHKDGHHKRCVIARSFDKYIAYSVSSRDKPTFAPILIKCCACVVHTHGANFILTLRKNVRYMKTFYQGIKCLIQWITIILT